MCTASWVDIILYIWWCIVQKIRYIYHADITNFNFLTFLMNKIDMLHHTGNVTVYTKELFLCSLMMSL